MSATDGGDGPGTRIDAPGRMPWRCPACRTVIRHNPFEDVPHVGVDYRCHVCRLELELDPDTERLEVTAGNGQRPDYPAHGIGPTGHGARPVERSIESHEAKREPPDLSDQILQAIRRQIGVAFRTGVVSKPFDDARTGNIVFRIRHRSRRLKVIVTGRVLSETGNAREVQILLKRLVTLPDHLKALKHGGSLTITSEGFRT